MVTLNSHSIIKEAGVKQANNVLKNFDIEVIGCNHNRQFAVMNEYATLKVLKHGKIIHEAGTGEDLIRKLGEILPDADLQQRRMSITEDYGRNVLEVQFDAPTHGRVK